MFHLIHPLKLDCVAESIYESTNYTQGPATTSPNDCFKDARYILQRKIIKSVFPLDRGFYRYQ